MIRTLATLVLLAAALALHAQALIPLVPGTHLDFDAVHVYLPLARRLLDAGPDFLLTAASAQAPPVAYLYPALFGADLVSVKHANIALSCGLLLLVFRTATLWHSRLAGVLAAFAYGLSPLLRPFLPTALTEPPFLFLLGAWIWALSEWRIRDRPAYLPIAGVALGLAILTRASLFYALVAFVAYLAWHAWRHRSRAALAAHCVALALPLAFIAKNWLAFRFPFFATGAGNALYLGTSPLFGGFDPGYLGLTYDVGAITRSPSHLTPEADALLGAAARLLLSTLDLRDLAAMYAHKLAAFLFITNAENGGDVFALRAWRIATLVLGAVGLAAMRDRWLRGVVALLLLYQVAVHVPALYNHRYSVSALDAWLALLSGVGLGWLWERRGHREVAAVASLALAAVMAGGYFAWNGGMPQPNVFAAENVLVWEGGGDRVKFAGREASLEIEIPDAPGFSPYFNHVLVLDSTLARRGSDAACGNARFTYRRHDRDAFSAPMAHRFRSDGERRVEQVGAQVPLDLATGGRLRIDLDCVAGSTWDLHRIAVYSARGALALRERLVSSPGAMPR